MAEISTKKFTKQCSGLLDFIQHRVYISMVIACDKLVSCKFYGSNNFYWINGHPLGLSSIFWKLWLLKLVTYIYFSLNPNIGLKLEAEQCFPIISTTNLFFPIANTNHYYRVWCFFFTLNHYRIMCVPLMQPSMGILTLPCPRVVKHSASTRRRIFTYKKSRLDESLPYLFLAAVNLHRTSLWGMVNLYLIMLIL